MVQAKRELHFWLLCEIKRQEMEKNLLAAFRLMPRISPAYQRWLLLDPGIGDLSRGKERNG